MRALPIATLVLLSFSAGRTASCAPQPATFRDPRGLTIQLPTGWRATADPATTRITVNGPEQARLLIHPFAYGEPLDTRTGTALLSRIAASMSAGVRWQAASSGARLVQVRGTRGATSAVCALMWTNGAVSAAAWALCAEVPTARAARFTGDLEAMVASVQLRGSDGPTTSAGAAPPGGGTWTTFVDPAERAFSFDVPSTWTVRGGLHRRAPVDVVVGWVITPPDGALRITGGDRDLPTFIEPHPALEMTGLREGGVYSPGYGVSMRIQRYLPAPAFVQWYVRERAAAGCADLRVIAQRDRTREFDRVNALYAQLGATGVMSVLTASDLVFGCTVKGVPYRGYYFATVRRTSSTGPGMWNMDQLYGYLAPETQVGSAHAALVRSIASFRLNPEWARMQGNITDESSRIIATTSQTIAELSRASNSYRDAVNSEAMRQQSNAMLGVTDARDPVTGREFKVSNASTYSWIDAKGRIAGTDVDVKPAGVDVRQLFTW